METLVGSLKRSVTLLVTVLETILDIISDTLGDTYREEKCYKVKNVVTLSGRKKQSLTLREPRKVPENARECQNAGPLRKL